MSERKSHEIKNIYCSICFSNFQRKQRKLVINLLPTTFRLSNTRCRVRLLITMNFFQLMAFMFLQMLKSTASYSYHFLSMSNGFAQIPLCKRGGGQITVKRLIKFVFCKGLFFYCSPPFYGAICDCNFNASSLINSEHYITLFPLLECESGSKTAKVFEKFRLIQQPYLVITYWRL